MKISFIPLKIVGWMFVIMPGAGLLSVFLAQRTLLNLSVDKELLTLYAIYAILISVFLYTAPNDGMFAANQSLQKIPNPSPRRLLLLCTFCFIIVFILMGQYTLTHKLERGVVRSSLGLLGFLYNVIVRFFLPALAFLVTFSIFKMKRKRYYNYFSILLVFMTAFMTGTKSIFIFVFLPAATLLWPLASFRKKVYLFLVAIASILLQSMIFENREFIEALLYAGARSTVVAAYGITCVWDYLQNYGQVSLLQHILFSIFGNHVSDILFDAVGINFSGNISKIITMIYYPAYDLAKAGSTNLTLTLLGELLLFFGYWSYLIIILFGIGIVIVFNKMKKYIVCGQLKYTTMMMVFITFVLFPVINSSGIFSLISIPNILYLTALYIILTYIFLKPIRIDDRIVPREVQLKQ